MQGINQLLTQSKNVNSHESDLADSKITDISLSEDISFDTVLTDKVEQYEVEKIESQVGNFEKEIPKVAELELALDLEKHAAESLLKSETDIVEKTLIHPNKVNNNLLNNSEASVIQNIQKTDPEENIIAAETLLIEASNQTLIQKEKTQTIADFETISIDTTEIENDDKTLAVNLKKLENTLHFVDLDKPIQSHEEEGLTELERSDEINDEKKSDFLNQVQDNSVIEESFKFNYAEIETENNLNTIIDSKNYLFKNEINQSIAIEPIFTNEANHKIPLSETIILNHQPVENPKVALAANESILEVNSEKNQRSNQFDYSDNTVKNQINLKVALSAIDTKPDLKIEQKIEIEKLNNLKSTSDISTTSDVFLKNNYLLVNNTEALKNNPEINFDKTQLPDQKINNINTEKFLDSIQDETLSQSDLVIKQDKMISENKMIFTSDLNSQVLETEINTNESSVWDKITPVLNKEIENASHGEQKINLDLIDFESIDFSNINLNKNDIDKLQPQIEDFFQAYHLNETDSHQLTVMFLNKVNEIQSQYDNSDLPEIDFELTQDDRKSNTDKLSLNKKTVKKHKLHESIKKHDSKIPQNTLKNFDNVQGLIESDNLLEESDFNAFKLKTNIEINQNVSHATATIQHQNQIPQQKIAVAQSALAARPGTLSFREGFSERVVFLVKNEISAASIKLNPAELGPLEINIKLNSNHQADLVITTQHLLTKDSIEQALPRLKEMLSESGIQLNQVNINDQSQRQANQNSSQNHSNAMDIFDEASELDLEQNASSIISTHHTRPDGLVDFYA